MAKKIRENGIVLSKVIKPATEGFVSNGQVVPAMPERLTVIVACGAMDGDNGIQDMVLVKFVVEKEQYEKLVYAQSVEVAYEYNGDGKVKPIEIIG